MNRSNPYHVVRQGDETPAERASRLQAEAKRAAFEHLDAMQADIVKLIATATLIGAGGEAYPPGARDICRRMAEDLSWKGQTLETIARNRP